MATGQRFPSVDHVMWRNNLEDLPQAVGSSLESLLQASTPSFRQRTKAYALAVESYTLPSSVETNACDSRLGLVYARATCYRSQKKTGRPYKVRLTFKLSSGAVEDATCECPAGESGACSPILAALQLLIFMRKRGYKEAPPELSCTELPQQWRRPRRQGIRPVSVQEVDWRSPRENGVPEPTPRRLFDARAVKDDEKEQLDSLHQLGRVLKELGNDDFGMVLMAAKGLFVETKLGLAPVGSPLSYQRAIVPGGFKTWMSSSISKGTGDITPVPELLLFEEALPHTLCGTYTADELRILNASIF
ncbi:hypothetical protein HPB52_009718 [Rhipicephalus sanguineus]|uniref:SWIM-type domain-containing protein n=1 Tax=Rhipicephalus sanguineus TaxID=34632 RepID=A0A9D4SQ16_RHISA|nr:hypothetical protein HPB52_009718 [Rhipicephalus sanguineus]